MDSAVGLQVYYRQLGSQLKTSDGGISLSHLKLGDALTKMRILQDKACCYCETRWLLFTKAVGIQCFPEYFLACYRYSGHSAVFPSISVTITVVFVKNRPNVLSQTTTRLTLESHP